MMNLANAPSEASHVRLAKAGAEAVLVRASRRGRNAVDVALEVLVGGLRPLQHEIEPQAAFVVLARKVERAVVHGPGAAILQQFLEERVDALVMLVGDLLRLVAGRCGDPVDLGRGGEGGGWIS